MTEDGKGEAFLDRWSRRKKETAPQPAQPAAPVPPPAVEAKPAVPLQPVESLQANSDFTPFMASDVAPATRRAALKRLFATEAQFNVPDPFEPYSMDLTVSETISEEMLKTLHQAKRLIFDKPEPAAQAAGEAQPDPQAIQPQAHEMDSKVVAGKQDA